ncbi:hypothetical protein SAMN05216464_101624 [Mucilaginibacter pineti]|uniref:O-Antigen ligase n=1 Tax=Mucilaginibacter pineti TaxID=1391627 RepID=A0A1G6UGV7_9SPHI|nr:hypothetical protein [Mucilaginibacter pineti]SDD39817.1 hypothetical protein SAMN05216464_101624 [Mucilaginibacter pineti]
MNKQQLTSFLLLMLILASFFHVQPVVLGIAIVIIAMPLNQQLAAIKMARLFALLQLPVIFGLVVGYENNTYLIFKDFYYFSIPLLFITAGIVMACRLTVDQFLKTIVLAGVITSFVVTGISISYMGLGALTDPYSAHYAIGIVGTPVPPLALACLLICRKFNIKLYTRIWFNALTAINVLGVYMFASRTYLIITLCFLMLLVADKIKRLWIPPVVLSLVIIFTLLPLDALKVNSNSGTFVNKILGSFSEVSIGQYNTEQDINIKYRGYESFMALKGYTEGGMKDWVFGGLGKLIDLKTFVRLGEDTDFQYIPVLHNGWLYILVKTGAVGVLLYASVFFSLIVINWRRYADASGRPVIRLFAALTLGCIISLLLTNYIVTAFFNVEMSVLMITLGYSYLNFHALVFRLKSRQETQEIKYEQAIAY